MSTAQMDIRAKPAAIDSEFELSAGFIEYVKKLQAELVGNDEALKVQSFMKSLQGAKESDIAIFSAKIGSKSFFEVLLSYLSSADATAQAPVHDNDLTYPLSNYFVSSSHNTYLSGNQLYSVSSVDAYKNVLSKDAFNTLNVLLIVSRCF